MNWSSIFTQMLEKFKPFMSGFMFPVIFLILAFLLVKAIVTAVMNYRRGDEINIMPIIMIVIALAILTALSVNDNLFKLFGVIH